MMTSLLRNTVASGQKLCSGGDGFPVRGMFRFYPQVLKRVLHIVVGEAQQAGEAVSKDKLLNFLEIKKRLANPRAIHSQWLTNVARILSLF